MKNKIYLKWGLLSLITIASIYSLTTSVTTKADYNDHPRIMLTPERITRAYNQHYLADSYEWQQLIRGADRNSDMDAARAQAFVYVITGDTAYADSAIALLEEEMEDPMTVGFNSVGGKFLNMACVYDWLYNYPGFTAELKQQMIDYVNAVPMNGSGRWNWYPDTVYMNGVGKPLQGTAVWGLATYGDNPDADVYIDNGLDNRWAYIRNGMGYSQDNHAENRGGSQPRGMDYGSGFYAQVITYLDALKTSTDVNLFDEAPVLKEYLEWFAKSYYYTEDFIRRPEHGHNAHKEEAYHPNAIKALRILIDNYSDTTEAKWAQWWFNNTSDAQSAANDYRYSGPEGVIFTNYDQATQSFASEPLAYFSEGNGSWVARSDWPANGQEPMTYATFRAGNWTWFSQTHWDQGDFDLYSHGAPLLVDGGTYEGGGGAPTRAYHYQSVAHNTLLIKDPEQEQTWDSLSWASYDPEWNTGGQSVPYRETELDAVLDGEVKDASVPNNQVKYLHDAADIERRTHNDRYTYAWADMTNAYANSRWEEDYAANRLNEVNYRPKVENVSRHWIYLRPRTGNDQEYIVTFDRVESVDASFQKKNLLHTIGEPILDGSVVDTEVAGHVETYDANSFAMTYDGAVLHGEIVLPANAQVRRVGGYDYEYYVNGVNHYPFGGDTNQSDNHKPEAGVWRMEIMPPTAQTNDLFLNVLHPDWSGTAAPTVSGISSSLHEGTSFDGWVLMFSDQEIVRDQAVYTVAMDGAQRHLVFDMESNYDYSIYQNDQLITTVNSGSEGIVEFAASTGGNFGISQGDGGPPLDTTPPSGSISINSGDDTTNSVNVTLTLSATDDSGVSQMQFSNDNSTWSDAESYSTSKDWTLTDGDGTKTVYVKFSDTEDNWNTDPYSDTITLDTSVDDVTSPNGSISINSGDTTTDSVNVTLTLSATDDSGVSQMQFSNDNSTWSDAESYSTSKDWILTSGDGIKTVYVKFSDIEDNWNVTPYSDTITLDTSVDDPPPGGGGGNDDPPADDPPPEDDPPVDDEELDHLTGVDWETLERVSGYEAVYIYNYDQYVNLDDIEVYLYSNLVARQASELSSGEKYSMAMFIHYGTQTTYRLGAGERAGVVNSYRSVFGRLPKTSAEWQDVIKIANGRWPYENNTDKETEAESNKFQKVYLRSADMNNPNDNAAVTIMTYGLRPVDRNMDSERNGINIFRDIYGYDPTSAEDWDIVRAIAYSGAIR
jgi:hypothetical protein